MLMRALTVVASLVLGLSSSALTNFDLRPGYTNGVDGIVIIGDQYSSLKEARTRAPDFEKVAYAETNVKQRFCLWLPLGEWKPPYPVVVNIHGGGYTQGHMVEPEAAGLIAQCDKVGVAFLSMQYIFSYEAEYEGVFPPVAGCYDDVKRCLEHLIERSETYGIDPSRIALNGGSAGAALALRTALSPECPPIAAIRANEPQTTLDPEKMREWLPNIEYGPHAFGCKTFDEFLARRSEFLPWIKRYGACELVPIAAAIGRTPRIYLVNRNSRKDAYNAAESVHAPVFTDKLKELLDANGFDASYQTSQGDPDAFATMISDLVALPTAGAVEAPRDVIAFIADKLARGVKYIQVPKCRYTINTRDAIYLHLKGLSDVTIDFNGSELLGIKKTRMIQLEDCTNTVIRNVAIDYPFCLPFTEAKILSVDAEKNWEVEVIKGYPLTAEEEGDGDCWPLQVYDGKTFALKNPMRFRDNLKFKKIGERRYRITGGRDRRGEVGDIAVWSNKEKRNAAVSALVNLRGEGCSFERVIVYATPHGPAFEDLYGSSSSYFDCQVIPRKEADDPVERGMKRLRSGNHDAFMNRCQKIGPKLIRCMALNHCDDCVNISGMYSIVLDCNGVDLRVAASYRDLQIDVGDKLQIMTKSGQPIFGYRVQAIAAEGEVSDEERKILTAAGLWPGLAENAKKAYRVTLDHGIALDPGDVIMSDFRAGNGFLLKDCAFGNARARGALVKASNGTIENCLFRNCDGVGVHVATEYQWMEGGLSNNVEIRSCRFENNGDGVIVGGTTADGGMLPPAAHTNIKVCDNVFIGTGNTVTLGGCNGATVKGNSNAVCNFTNSVRTDYEVCHD